MHQPNEHMANLFSDHEKDIPEWAILLHAPYDYVDYTTVFEVFDPRFLLPEHSAVFKGRLKNIPETTWVNKRPRTQFILHDLQHTISFSLFGDQRHLTQQLKKGDIICVHGTIYKDRGRVYLNGPNLLSESQLGTFSPLYKLSNEITPIHFYEQVNHALHNCLSIAVASIRKFLKQTVPNSVVKHFLTGAYSSLDQLIYALHAPNDKQSGFQALTQLKKLVSLLTAASLYQLTSNTTDITIEPIVGVDPKTLTTNIPFTLTDEQFSVIMQLIENMYYGKKLHGLLVGDVGTGKTVVYAIACQYVVSAGGRVAILLPNQNLAKQIYDEISSYFPNTSIDLITGSSKKKQIDSQITIGTTALLFRDVGNFSLVVCDEQQKMSISQRQKLLTAETHLLEVSATPIPRSLALALYGAVKVFTLKNCHVEKNIITNICKSDQKAQLMKDISDTLSIGKQVLVVCARCEGDKKDTSANLISAEAMFEGLSRFFPGQVAIAHSKLQQSDNQVAIADMKAGKANILVSTTVIEVGLTIPNLERIIIVNADRYGLSQIHQLRGRVARKGGTGYCTLYLPQPVNKQETLDRLNTIANTNDGFELSKMDLRLRGAGDVLFNLGQQHGQSISTFKGIEINMSEVDHAFEYISTSMASKDSSI